MQGTISYQFPLSMSTATRISLNIEHRTPNNQHRTRLTAIQGLNLYKKDSMTIYIFDIQFSPCIISYGPCNAALTISTGWRTGRFPMCSIWSWHVGQSVTPHWAPDPLSLSIIGIPMDRLVA